MSLSTYNNITSGMLSLREYPLFGLVILTRKLLVILSSGVRITLCINLRLVSASA